MGDCQRIHGAAHMVSKMQEKERPAAMTQRRQRPPESADFQYVVVEYRGAKRSVRNIILFRIIYF